MLRLAGEQVESLWDEVLPVEVRELPADLAVLDGCWAIRGCWRRSRRRWEQDGARAHGRPTIAMATLRAADGGQAAHRLGLRDAGAGGVGLAAPAALLSDRADERVPDESTVRKLARRLGPEVVDEITRVVIGKAQRETRFAARAVRIDSTVVEADIRYPTDAVLALAGRAGAGPRGPQARRWSARARPRVRDRSRAIGRTVRAISQHARRGAPARRKAEVIELNAQAGELIARSVREARRLAAQARARGARPRRPGQAARRRAARGARRPLPSRSPTQIQQRVAGEKITDRLVSLADPDARPIRKGKLGKPNEFGYVAQLAEVTAEHPPRRARVHPAGRHARPATRPRTALLPEHRRRARPARTPPARGRARRRLRARPDHRDRSPSSHPSRSSSPAASEPGSRRTRRRLARYRTGAEGRISHLKRGYGLRRSRLKGHHGQRTWTGWAILAYNLDTLAIHTA